MSDQKLSVRVEFDAKAADYDTNRLASWYHAHNDAIYSHLQFNPSSRLLDIGCGTGYLIRSVLRDMPGITAVGVDLAPQMIATAREATAEFGGGATFYEGDWEQPGGALLGDLAAMPPSHVVCASTMHYFSDPVASLRRIQEVLRPGGTFFLLERRLEDSVLTRAWDFAHRHFIKDHVRFYGTSDLLDMIDKAGFASAEVAETIRKLFWNNKLNTNLSLIKAIK